MNKEHLRCQVFMLVFLQNLQVILLKISTAVDYGEQSTYLVNRINKEALEELMQVLDNFPSTLFYLAGSFGTIKVLSYLMHTKGDTPPINYFNYYFHSKPYAQVLSFVPPKYTYSFVMSKYLSYV